MKFLEFKKNISDNIVSEIYLFDGEDSFFKERSLEILKNKYLQYPEMNFNIFQGDLKNIEQFVLACFNMPFMSEKRIVLVRDFYPLVKDLENKALKDYFENPEKNTILCFVNSKSSDALKKCKKLMVVDCSKGDIQTICKWIINECNKSKIKISNENANLIAEYCNRNMTTINSEMKKILAYCFDKTEVDRETIQLLVSKGMEFQIYEMVNEIAKHNEEKTFEILQTLLANNENPQILLISIYNHYRRLFHISVSNKSVEELSKLLGIKEYAIQKLKEQVKSMNKKTIKKNLDTLSQMDKDIKSGKLNVLSALNLSIIKLLNT